MNLKQVVTSHYMAHWGVPTGVSKREVHTQTIPDLAIFEFAPKRQRQSSRLATNGMSAYVQSSEKNKWRTEIFLCCLSPHEWMMNLLSVIAQYPGEQETAFQELNTIPVNGPMDGMQSPYTSVLLAPPGPEDAETLGVVASEMLQPIIIHQIVGLFDSEYAFALEKGSKPLWKLLLELNQPLLVDQLRPRVV